MHILSPVTNNCPSWKSGRRNESILPDRVSNPGPLTYESGALPIALRGPVGFLETTGNILGYIYFPQPCLYARSSVFDILHKKSGPGRVAQSVACLTQEPEVPSSIPGPATYFRLKGSCQLLATVCARSTG